MSKIDSIQCTLLLLASSPVILPQAISLHLQNRVRIASEFLQGHVELNVSLALENGIQAFHCSALHLEGSISYALEVVVDRPGEWKAVIREDRIRRKIWGDYSIAKTKPVMPALAAFPMSTPVPFRIHVTTETKPMKHTDGPEHELFPAPPLNFSQLKFTLIRNVYFRTSTRKKHHLDVLGETDRSPQSVTRLLEADPPEWNPSNEDKSKGIWRRTKSKFVALWPAAPCVVSWDRYYVLLALVSVGRHDRAWVCVPQIQPFSRGPNLALTYADIPPPGPTPSLDLPRAYWAGKDHDWDHKKG
ncbi:hypothetical protein DFH08DRAFT_1000951 [Mycena albidolilacea]|uniref:Arrestin-like N-terminal domain-containing protein n=1 Tax=Mycena albidolilacea TaxID=1033008 RepID=A0AAD7A2V2_9AGAR|nr:hypothetical protein DFH08DRAFT_1000951 [Mycena albidolilacea]